MKVSFRSDASLKIGTGHVMRCLTLANLMKNQGWEVSFICRNHTGNLIDLIGKHNIDVYKLITTIEYSGTKELFHSNWLGVSQHQDAQDCLPILQEIQPDWLIVDHYALDAQWENQLKNVYKRLMVIDDIADRNHSCDLLLDQTLGRIPNDYESLVPDSSFMMLGAQYALLRPEFAECREYSLKRRKQFQLRNILVSLGGTDPDNFTAQVLDVLNHCSLPETIRVTVVLGVTYPHLESIKKLSKKMSYNIEFAINISNMAEVMSNSDIAIGAAGSTTWERCCLGLPTIQIVTAENQNMIARTLSDNGAVFAINNLKELPEAIKTVERSMSSMSANAKNVTDGKGAVRVIERLSGLNKT